MRRKCDVGAVIREVCVYRRLEVKRVSAVLGGRSGLPRCRWILLYVEGAVPRGVDVRNFYFSGPDFFLTSRERTERRTTLSSVRLGYRALMTLVRQKTKNIHQNLIIIGENLFFKKFICILRKKKK